MSRMNATVLAATAARSPAAATATIAAATTTPAMRYTTELDVSIERVGGRAVPHVAGFAMSSGDFARQYGADLRRQVARARRVLARCLAQ